MFTLPASIRTICFIQFFANLGWYPVMFFTSLWVSDIFKQNHPQGETVLADWEAEAVRAGSRALFLQSIIAFAVSAAAPFLVAGSGIQSSETNAYRPINPGPDSDDDPPNSAIFKRREEDRSEGSWTQRAAASVGTVIRAVKTGSAWALPIKGLTLIRLWFIAQIIFALCMLCTWFTSTVNGAYTVIAITGFSWGLAQWAPFALLGELVLIDAPDANRTEMRALSRAPATEVVFAAENETRPTSALHSRSTSRNHVRQISHEVVTLNDPHPLARLAIPGGTPPPPIPREPSIDLDLDTTVVLRHSDEHSDASDELLSPEDNPSSTADKAGLILGIHNVFIVLPQFVITAISSVIFAILEPGHSAKREAVVKGPSSPNAVGVVFRIGGVAAAVGAFLSYRLARRWANGQVHG